MIWYWTVIWGIWVSIWLLNDYLNLILCGRMSNIADVLCTAVLIFGYWLVVWLLGSWLVFDDKCQIYIMYEAEAKASVNIVGFLQ